MSEGCIPVEDLGRVVALPEDDPARMHLDACARCGALAEMLAEFARPAQAPAEAGAAEVDRALLTTIADITGVPADATEPLETLEPGAAREFLPEPRRRGFLGFGGLQLAGAFAALALVGIAGFAFWRSHPGTPQMRDGSAAAGAAFTELAARSAPGGVAFTWAPVPHATAYEVVFLDESLREVARLAATPATTARLDAAALPAGLAHGQSVGWEVEALAGTDRLAVSPTRALRVP